MYAKNILLVAFVSALVAGCSVFTSARKAQDEVAAKGRGDAVRDFSALNLRARPLSWLVDFAMTNRPSVAAARFAVEDAKLNLKTIAADAPIVSKTPWTSLELTGDAAYSVASEQSRHLDGLEFSSDGTFSGSLSLGVLLYDFGRNNAAAEAASEDLIAAELNLVETGFLVFEEVAGAYFSVQEKSALLEVAITNEFEYAEHLRRARDLLDAGEAQMLDVTRARLDLSQAKELTVAASNNVTVAIAELMFALGIETGRANANMLMPAAGEALSSVNQAFADSKYDFNEAFSLARTNAPAMAVSRARLRAASSKVDYALADLLPRVSARTSLSWADPMWVWSSSLSVVQSLFQGFRKTTAVDRSVVAMRSAATAVDEAEQQLCKTLEIALAERDNAVKARETASVSLADALENLKTVKMQYLEGDADRIDFASSVAAYTTALGNRVSAFYKGQRAEAKLFRTTGRMPVWLEKKITEVK